MSLRSRWQQEGTELKKSVIRDLLEWRRYYHGGLPDLGYPHEQPFYTPPRHPDHEKPARCLPEPDADRAQWLEDCMVLWRLMAERAGDRRVRKRLRQLLHCLLLRFRDGKPVSEIAKHMHCSRQHAYVLIDESLYRLWVITQ